MNNNESRFNSNFMDSMACMGFAIGLMNLKENLEQSKNNDIIDQIGTKTSAMIEILEKDLQKQNVILQQQNKMLEDILKRLNILQQKEKLRDDS